MLNFTPMVLLPSLLQNQLGFPDGLIGYVVSWRGVGVMVGFFSAMVTTRLDVRVGMVVGFGIQILSGIWLTSIDFNVSLFTLCANAFLQGFAVGMIWMPIATSAFWTLDPSLRADGVAVFHLHAQHRLELLHLDVRGRDRARNRRQLQPHDGVRDAVQPDAVAADGHGQLDDRQPLGPRGAVARRSTGRRP